LGWGQRDNGGSGKRNHPSFHVPMPPVLDRGVIQIGLVVGRLSVRQ
jgi:hypothetical protein